MPNAWVEHVRNWAKKNKLSYACSVGKPKCRAEYYADKGVSVPAGGRKRRVRRANDIQE
jgi:hypothetical protein